MTEFYPFKIVALPALFFSPALVEFYKVLQKPLLKSQKYTHALCHTFIVHIKMGTARP